MLRYLKNGKLLSCRPSPPLRVGYTINQDTYKYEPGFLSLDRETLAQVKENWSFNTQTISIMVSGLGCMGDLAPLENLQILQESTLNHQMFAKDKLDREWSAQ